MLLLAAPVAAPALWNSPYDSQMPAWQCTQPVGVLIATGVNSDAAREFSLYAGGVYDNVAQCGSSQDHAVVLTGYSSSSEWELAAHACTHALWCELTVQYERWLLLAPHACMGVHGKRHAAAYNGGSRKLL